MGAEAAKVAVRVLTAESWRAGDAPRMFQTAHRAMREELDTQQGGAAVTAALLDLSAGQVWFVWTGDVLGLTWDDNQVWQIKPHRIQRHKLERALTSYTRPEPEVAGPFPLQHGTKVALLSDGVWDVGLDYRPFLQPPPRLASQRLVREALAQPTGGDNATALIVEVFDREPPPYQGAGRPAQGRAILLKLLRTHPYSAKELAAQRQCSVRWVRQQLRLLLLDGLVAREEGRWRAA